MVTVHERWKRKQYDAKKRGIGFDLTLEQFEALILEAGITVDQIGQRGDQYCLGRVNDEGAYTVGNCRFITVAQNNQEGARSKRDHGLSVGGGRQDANTGKRHHKHKGRIITPWGTFDSLQDAENAPGATVKRNAIHKRIMRGEPGYKFA